MVVAAQLVAEVTVQGVSQAQGELASMGQSVSSLGIGMGATLVGAAVAAGVALVGIGVASVKAAGDFQEMTTTLVTGAGEQASNLEMVRQGLLNLSVATGTSVKQLTDGMFMIESAGYHGKSGLDVLATAAEGAKVANADLGTVADALTTVMKDFGISAQNSSQAMNFLTAIVQNGKTTLQDLSASMSQILPTASAVHVHLQDVGAAMATMTGEGVPAANAATYLRQMLISLAAPSAGAVSSLKAIGLTSQQVSDEMKVSLPETLKLIMTHLAETYKVGSPEYVNALKNIAGGSRQMQGMLDLTGQHLLDFQNNLKNVTNTMNQGKGSVVGWDQVQQNFNFRLSQAKEAVHALFIELGTKLLPIVTPVVGWFGQLLQNIVKFVQGGQPLPPLLQDIADTLRQMGQIAKAVFQGVFGDGIARLRGAFQSVQPAVQGIGETLHQVFMRIQAVLSTLNVQALVDGIKQVLAVLFKVSPTANAFESLSRHAQDLAKWFQTALVPAVKQAEPGFMQLVQAGMKLWPIMQQIADTVHNTVQKAFDALLPVFERAVPFVIKLAGVLADGLGRALQFLLPYIGQAVQALVQFAGDIITRVAPIVEDFFHQMSIALDAFLKIWNFVWPILAPILKGVWDEIVGVVKIAWALLSGIFKVALDLLSGNWKQAWTDIQDMAKGVWDGIVTFFQGAWGILQGLFKGALALIVGIFGGTWQQMQKEGGQFFSQLGTIVHNGVTAIGNFFSWLGTQAHTIWDNMVKGIQNIVTGVKNWLNQTWQNIVNTVVGWFQWLYNHNYYFKNLVDFIITAFTNVKNFLISVWQTLSSWLSNAWKWLQNTASTIFNAVMTFFSNVWNSIKNTAVSIWNSLTSWLSGIFNSNKQNATNTFTSLQNTLQGIWNNIVTAVHTAWNNISSVFASAWNTYIAGPLSRLWNSFTGWFGNLANQALQWGKNLIQNIINGINSMAGAVANAAQNIAQTIAGFLGFHSPTKYGPGSMSHLWAPALMSMFSRGLEAGIPGLQSSLGKVAGTLAQGFQVNTQASLSGSGVAFGGSAGLPTVVHVHVQQPDLTLDGQRLTRAQMPYIVQHIRQTTATRF